ncbi:hypothetical protein RQP46_010802 [Phenoliferia psychrophenolica]
MVGPVVAGAVSDAYGWRSWAFVVILAIAIGSAVPVSGDLLAAVTVNKNVWGYGVSQFLIPVFRNPSRPDLIVPIMVNTGLTIVFVLLGSIVLLFGGKWVRPAIQWEGAIPTPSP